LLIASPGTFLLAGVPALLGAFFAATDGVLSALASHVVPAPARTTSLAILGIVLAGGRAVAAAGFGMVWLGSGPHRALVDAAGASRRSGARLAESGAAASPGRSQIQAQSPVDLSGSLAVLAARPHLLVRDTTEGADFDRLEVADLADPAGPRALTGIGCARVD